MKRLSLVWLLAFLVLASVASADIDVITYPAQSSFSAYSGGSQLSLCQCELGVDTITVANTGAFASRYVIAHDAPGLVSIGENGFDLLPGQSKTVYAYVQAPCDEVFSRDFSYTITDINGDSSVIGKSVSVDHCQNLQASLAVSASVIDPCEPVSYDVIIDNTGVFTETYDVFFEHEAFDTSSLAIIIPPGERGILSADLELDCSVYGNVSVPVLVQARNNGLEAELVHDLTVRHSYPFTVTSSIPELCAQDSFTFPFTVTNDAAVENVFTVSYEGPDYLSLMGNGTLVLGPGESADVVFSGLSSVLVDGNLSVSVAARYGDEVKTVSVPLSFANCYDLRTTIQAQEDVLDCSGRREYPLLVENLGSRDVMVDLYLDGTEYASALETSFPVPAGGSYETSLVIDVPVDVSVSGYAGVTAAVRGKEAIAADALGVDMRSAFECYEVSLAKRVVKARYSDSEVVVPLRHLGLASSGSYLVEYDGPSFLSLDPVVIDLGNDGTASVVLSTYADDSDVQQYYGGSLFVSTGEGDGRVVYELPFDVEMRSAPFLVTAYNYAVQEPCHVASLFLLAFIIIGVLVLSFSRGKRVRNSSLLTVLIVLWLIAVLVSLALHGSPQPVHDALPISEDPLEFVMAEDSSLSLNLSELFVDPDADMLDFTVSEMDDVDVVVTDGVAVFTPVRDWSGQRRFRIEAFDGRGASTESPRLSLRVLDRPEVTPWYFYDRYCSWVNLVLLLVVAVLIFFLSGRKEARAPLASKSDRSASRSAPKRVAKKKAAKKRVAKKSTKKKTGRKN